MSDLKDPDSKPSIKLCNVLPIVEVSKVYKKVLFGLDYIPFSMGKTKHALETKCVSKTFKNSHLKSPRIRNWISIPEYIPAEPPESFNKGELSMISVLSSFPHVYLSINI